MAALQTVATAALDLVKGAKYTGPVVASIPFCSKHRDRRLRRFYVGGGLMALASAYLVIRYLRGAPTFADLVFSLDSVIAIFAGVAGIGVVMGAAYEPSTVWFRTKKYYDRFVWVEGAGQEFLRTLPTLASRFEDEGSSPAPGAPSAKKGTADQRLGSKKPGGGANPIRKARDGDEANLSAEVLIRRARLAGVDDDEE